MGRKRKQSQFSKVVRSQRLRRLRERMIFFHKERELPVGLNSTVRPRTTEIGNTPIGSLEEDIETWCSESFGSWERDRAAEECAGPVGVSEECGRLTGANEESGEPLLLHSQETDGQTSSMLTGEMQEKFSIGQSLSTIKITKTDLNCGSTNSNDDAPYIRRLHQSGLSYVDIEKTLREEGRYISRQTISLVARNLKTSVRRQNRHAPKVEIIPDDVQKCIEKGFRENANEREVQMEMEERFHIKLPILRLMRIRSGLQRKGLTDVRCRSRSRRRSSSCSSQRHSSSPVPTPDSCHTPVESPPEVWLIQSSPESSCGSVRCSSPDTLPPESKVSTVPSTSNNSHPDAAKDIEPNKPENAPSNINGAPALDQEEPLSIVCCPDLLTDTLNEKNEAINGYHLPEPPLSIVCCPDLPGDGLSTLFHHNTLTTPCKNYTFNSNEESSESLYQPVIRKLLKVPPKSIQVLRPNGNFSIEFLTWAKNYASWEGNFAATLSQYIFTDKERIECNCQGIRKKALDPSRLEKIKQAVYLFYDCADEDKYAMWSKCIKAIDSSSRTFRSKFKCSVPPIDGS